MITSGEWKIFFLAHLAKGNVSFCHHLASVFCRPLTFHILFFLLQWRRFFRNEPIRNKFIWPSGFGGEDFKKLANQKQELPVVAMFVHGSRTNVQSFERTF
jgi:hypothetical protein